MRTEGEHTLLQSPAGFAHSLSLHDVPKRVKREAKLCILDTLGCILAGSASPEGKMFLEGEKHTLMKGFVESQDSLFSRGGGTHFWLLG